MPVRDQIDVKRKGKNQMADDPAVALDGQTIVTVDPAVELEQYRRFVDKVATERNGRPIFNRSETHAAIIVEFLFKTATHEINILTQKLHVPVYGGAPLLDAAKRFLSNPSAELNVVSEENIPDDHPLIKGLLEAGYGRQVSRRVLIPAVAQNTPYHFAVADSSSVRFEPDKKLMAAVVKFGDEVFGKHLADRFHEISEHDTA